MNGSNDAEELDLSHYLDVLLRRRWIALCGFTLVFVLAALHAYTYVPVYQANALLVIERERGGTKVLSDGTMIQSDDDDYYQTQYKLLKSESLLRRVYERLDLSKTADFPPPHGLAALSGAVDISPVLRSRLVYASVRSHDPVLAASVANTLAQTFVDQNMSNELFISKEVLRALQAGSDDPGARRTYASLPAVVDNKLIQDLKAEHAKLESEYADKSASLTPRHPEMIALRANITALQGQIDDETDKIVQSLKTQLSGQLKGNNVRIVDPATVSESPIKPNKRVELALGLIGGLGLGMALAFLVDALDQSVRTQEDVETKLGLPFLGEIPYSTQRDGAVYQSLLAKEFSLTSEAVRNLRTMIDFAGAPGGAKAILVTSTVQAEGKSYISANLAVSFSQLGEKVLLISGDLRRPMMHRSFSVSVKHGLADFLAKGQRVEELAGLVQKTDVPGVHVLPCGPRPPSPSELLNTPRLGALVAWAKSRYDRVIVDCTPLMPIHDTLLWGRHVGSAIYVVRYGRTRAPLINKACRRLQEGGVKVLGVAVNAARAGGLSASDYRYYYGAVDAEAAAAPAEPPRRS
jgi:capsular exopolysaccharide synthesis family protein